MLFISSCEEEKNLFLNWSPILSIDNRCLRRIVSNLYRQFINTVFLIRLYLLKSIFFYYTALIIGFALLNDSRFRNDCYFQLAAQQI